jgi:hypothetical protein
MRGPLAIWLLLPVAGAATARSPSGTTPGARTATLSPAIPMSMAFTWPDRDRDCGWAGCSAGRHGGQRRRAGSDQYRPLSDFMSEETRRHEEYLA